MSDEAFTAAEKQVEERLREAQQLSGRTARKLEALHVEKYKSASTTYEHLIRRNPRKFHRLLRPKLSQPCETCDESSGPSTQQSDEFREFFAALLRSRQQRAHGVGEKYIRNVPPTDPATMNMLVSPVQWQEVYAVLFPAHRLALREP